ncbi:MAG: glycosyltransferase [Leptolyngbyaceae cyanobacterium HOT.MB2.61]|nr:glycosyltransferase [Leptolyngbyaceae cyanobacterium HOT.MB2.61]
MRIALVHDYLTPRGGAERVFELLCRRYPEADIFTSLYDAEHTIDLGDRLVQTSVLQTIPGATKHFRLLAPLYFPVFRTLDLQDYDLIISSSSSFAQAVRKRADAHHICFCHNITRFLWDTQTYLREFSTYRKFYPLLNQVFQWMRQMDLKYSQEPDLYIANSSVVAHRIQKTYKKPVVVINYPIDSNQFVFSEQKEDYYLVSTRLISYKRIDIVIEAFNWLGLPLLIMGDDPERQRLESQAMRNIQFLGHVSDEERTQLMSRTRAVVVAALEDYGLVPVEANASGTPVIAYGAGGVLDTQIAEETGILFNRQTPESLQAALLKANKISWNHRKIREHALRHFSEEAFFRKVDQVFGRFMADGSFVTVN